MNKVAQYLKETYNELVYKVSWPTWPELQNSAIIVMIASLIIALIVFGMDFSFQKFFELLFPKKG